MRLAAFAQSVDPHEGVVEFTDALGRLGLRPPPVRVRIALRRWIWARNYKVPLRLIQTAFIVAVIVLYVHTWVWGLMEYFSFAESVAPPQRIGQPVAGQLGNPIVSASVTFLLIVGYGFSLHAFFTFLFVIPYGFTIRVWDMSGASRFKAAVARESVLVGRVQAVVLAADRVRGQGVRRQARNMGDLFRALRTLKRQIGRLHQGSSIPMTARARRLRHHQRLVVAAIEKAEVELDRSPLDSLGPVVELALKVADRYTQGLSAGLLPDEDLREVTPARDWEPLRMIIAAFLMAGTAVAVAFFDLPDPAITALLGATGLVSVSLMYGRGARSALDIVDVVRG